MRVCQFRHDGNVDLHCNGGPKAADQEVELIYSTGTNPSVAKRKPRTRWKEA